MKKRSPHTQSDRATKSKKFYQLINLIMKTQQLDTLTINIASEIVEKNTKRKEQASHRLVSSIEQAMAAFLGNNKELLKSATAAIKRQNRIIAIAESNIKDAVQTGKIQAELELGMFAQAL